MNRENVERLAIALILLALLWITLGKTSTPATQHVLLTIRFDLSQKRPTQIDTGGM